MKRNGIYVKKPLSLGGRNEIRSLGLPEFEHRLREFEALKSIVDELDKRIASAVSKDKRAQLVDTIPGVGPYTALFLSSALDDVNRFTDSNHAYAYVGLVPSLHQSGDLSYSGHITRQGNKWLRKNLVECTRWSIRKDPGMRQFYLRVARKRGKKKARVAVARKLLSYAYWALKRNLTYEELNPWKNDSG